LKVLNLYAGVGGNRKFWDAEVTAIESHPKIAEIYRHHFPDDEVIETDAHEYLLEHLQDGWDFIWSSPPCQSHSRMAISGTNRKPRYPDFKLYEEIVLLQAYSKRLSFSYCVENVIPYYSVLIAGQSVGRHLFWSDLDLSTVEEVASPKGFINKTTAKQGKQVQDWLGITWDSNVYYDGNHDAAQIWRNAVHPLYGKQIFDLLIALTDAGLHMG
jgi:DNA (cytosine-5)-methyltransferase 1